MTCLRTNQRSSFDVLGSIGNQMHAQICTLHDISAASDVASAHSLRALRTLAGKTTAVSVAAYFLRYGASPISGAKISPAQSNSGSMSASPMKNACVVPAAAPMRSTYMYMAGKASICGGKRLRPMWRIAPISPWCNCRWQRAVKWRSRPSAI